MGDQKEYHLQTIFYGQKMTISHFVLDFLAGPTQNFAVLGYHTLAATPKSETIQKKNHSFFAFAFLTINFWRSGIRFRFLNY